MPSFYLNTMLGSCLCLIIVFIDYSYKYNTDNFQRKLFLTTLAAAFLASASDFVTHVLTGMPGTFVTVMFYIVAMIFLIAQNIVHCMVLIFFDYIIYADTVRVKRGLKYIIVLLAMYTVSLFFNARFGFYFFISAQNVYMRGNAYILRVLISYIPLVIMIINVITSRKQIQSAHVNMLVLFFLLGATSSTIDIVLREGNLIWPCTVSGLLYIYFFIVQSDSKIDALTGINNRLAFNEFLNKLSRQLVPKSYSIVMIDIDHFKKINDTLGHIEGDRALRDMAEIIKTSIRHSDFAARYGGDEFVIAANSINNIEIIISRIEEALKNQNASGKRSYTLEISYGYDIFTTHSRQNISAFVDRIDKLMYEHKMSKRNQAENNPVLSVQDFTVEKFLHL
jgi:diguanylate cyclase (GGDEF)-like protein